MIYAATEGFFNEVLNAPESSRVRSLNPDKLRSAGEPHGVRLFTREWGVRTRVDADPCHSGNYSRWVVFEGEDLRNYLRDMKALRDLLAHGGDPFSIEACSDALWERKDSFKPPLILLLRRFSHLVEPVRKSWSGRTLRGVRTLQRSFLP